MSFRKIIFALDIPHIGYDVPYDAVIEKVGLVKVGMELFYGDHQAPNIYKNVFLDLKLNDIPETVGRATRTLCKKYKPKFLSVHLIDEHAVKRAVEEAAPFGTKIIGITVLTSMTNMKCLHLYGRSPAEQVEFFVEHAAFAAEGVGGFVCSGEEVELVRKLCPDAIIIVPGVRSAGADAGDQKRVVTPAEAIKSGADYVVIGREIRNAENPLREAEKIAKDIEEANCG